MTKTKMILRRDESCIKWESGNKHDNEIAFDEFSKKHDVVLVMDTEELVKPFGISEAYIVYTRTIVYKNPYRPVIIAPIYGREKAVSSRTT